MLATLARDLELDTVTVEQDDRVLLVRFCDPPHNFMTARIQKDLDILTAAVDADTSVGAVVLTGGVPKRYITHFDIAEILAAAHQRTGTVAPIPLPNHNSHQSNRSPTPPARPRGNGSRDLSKTERADLMAKSASGDQVSVQ
jgi:enoyl-CoA hydratase/carnithine racemase